MRFLKFLFVFVTSVALLILIGLFFMQKKFIFLPTKLPQEYAYNFQQPFEELFIETEDGAELNALHFKVENPKGIILYFHGNAGDLSRWGKITAEFTTYSYDVLIMDYRTYGKSTGTLSETNLYKDAQLFYNKALTHFPENKIIVYGRSLGTGLATYIASKNNPIKLVLETPFYNLSESAKHRIPLLPVRYLLKYKFPSNEYIISVNCPVTIFHGTEDSVVPYKFGEKLSKLILKEKLTFITIPKGKHNNLMSFDAYKEEIKNTLK